MVSWKDERDRLIAQTQAFVRQVAAKHPDASTPLKRPPPSVDASPVGPRVSDRPALATASPATTSPALRPKALYSSESERADIMQRVAAFKARQSQISREREAYYDTVQERIRSTLRSDPD